MKNTFLFLALLVLTVTIQAQNTEQNLQTIQDSTKVEILDEVLVKSVRVDADSPITHTNVSKKDLETRNLGQDIPILLNYLPSVVTTSDAGSGIGYTGIRIRGVSGESTNITINGIPYNDAESLGTFWVNLPDFSSSVESLQVQRGVGTSTNGSGAFGASINILTNNQNKEASASTSHSVGSFGTIKNNVQFGTGLLNNRFEVSGRLSKIKSDGFIDRASSDLKSYFLQGSYKDDNRLIKALVFGGGEKTYQAWYGVDVFTIDDDRTANIAGTIMDDAGNLEGYYDNQVDDYKQDHYQLHWNEKFNNQLSLNVGLNYTYGRGFYEEYIDNYFYTNVFFSDDSQFSHLGLNSFTNNGTTIESMDYIRQKWLDNDFYVVNTSLNYKNEKLDLVSGISYSQYRGESFGEVIWSEYAKDLEIDKGYRYYFSESKKEDFSVFSKATYKLNEKLSLFGDLQYRIVDYKINGTLSDRSAISLDKSFGFFNPKTGISYNLNNKNNFYFSYARANREPSRNDFENNPDVKAEELNDFELGYRYNNTKYRLNANIYYMAYNEQLVLTGALDDVGAPIRDNAGKSYRLGLELDGAIALSKKITLQSNLTLSENKNLNEGQFLNGEELGKTDIAYSPAIVTSTSLSYNPISKLTLTAINKYVDEQLMNNIEDQDSILDGYNTVDFNIAYEIKPKSIFKSILLSGVFNNVLDREYNGNGFDYGGGFYVFYPQAGTNFLLGATLNF
jgi:iron complex outermembrane receptor protein